MPINFRVLSIQSKAVSLLNKLFVISISLSTNEDHQKHGLVVAIKLPIQILSTQSVKFSFTILFKN